MPRRGGGSTSLKGGMMSKTSLKGGNTQNVSIRRKEASAPCLADKNNRDGVGIENSPEEKRAEKVNHATSSVELLSLLNEGMSKLNLNIPTFVICKDEPPIAGKGVLKTGIYIINLDDSQNGGTHWTLLFMLSPKKGIYIDSFGFPPPQIIVDKSRKDVNVVYSDVIIQSLKSEMCGLFAVANAFLIAEHFAEAKKSPKHFLNKIIHDVFVSGKGLDKNNVIVNEIIEHLCGTNFLT